MCVRSMCGGTAVQTVLRYEAISGVTRAVSSKCACRKRQYMGSVASW